MQPHKHASAGSAFSARTHTHAHVNYRCERRHPDYLWNMIELQTSSRRGVRVPTPSPTSLLCNLIWQKHFPSRSIRLVFCILFFNYSFFLSCAVTCKRGSNNSCTCVCRLLFCASGPARACRCDVTARGAGGGLEVRCSWLFPARGTTRTSNTPPPGRRFHLKPPVLAAPSAQGSAGFRQDTHVNNTHIRVSSSSSSGKHQDNTNTLNRREGEFVGGENLHLQLPHLRSWALEESQREDRIWSMVCIFL